MRLSTRRASTGLPPLGGSPAYDPQDHGFMYGSSFQDPNGHIWEVFWMDPAHVQG
jgi:predicted lactoylglutathione lyase